MGPCAVRGLVKVQIRHQVQVFRPDLKAAFFPELPYGALAHGFSRLDFPSEAVPLAHAHAPSLPAQEHPVFSVQQIHQ